MFADDISFLCTPKHNNNLKMKFNVVLIHMFMCFQHNEFALNLDRNKMIKFMPTSDTSYPLHKSFFNKMLKVAESDKMFTFAVG